MNVVRYGAQKIFKTKSLSLSASTSWMRGIQSPMVARYLVERLVNRFDIIGSVFRLLKGMIANWFTPGLMIQCSGRFTRKQRKMHKQFQQGRVAIHKFTHPVHYSSSGVRQKYGFCGIKVWLSHYPPRLFTYYNGKTKQISYRKKKFKIYKKFKKKGGWLQWSNFHHTNPSSATRGAYTQNPKGLFIANWYRNKQNSKNRTDILCFEK